MKIPFLDLQAQYKNISEEVVLSLQDVVANCAFSGGPYVEKFESEFAAFCDSCRAIGVGSGTEALWLVLAAIGVTAGDEVITVPNSFIATAEAISLCGAQPVFVDVDEASYTMNPALLEQAITKRTKAIIPVHLFGQMADMDEIMAIAQRYGIPVVEDACQAHGARYKGRRAGSIGIAGCFSFYPGKNLGAFGEAGAVVTNDPTLANTIAMMRDHGQSRKYHHEIVGINGRMDGIQAAVLSVKLKHLESWNDARRKNAARYVQALQGCKLTLPTVMPYAQHVFHIFAVRAQQRASLMEALAAKGIACAIHYPVPIHLQQAYSSLGKKEGSFPIAEDCAKEFMSLPMFPELTQEQVTYVASQIALLSASE